MLVDARTPEEQAVSMLPGAITQQEFERRAEDFKGRRVVAYCTIGYRSGEYTEALRADGWDAHNLSGSILAWTHAGQPLETPDGAPTKRLHIYGPKWDLAAEGYETVY